MITEFLRARIAEDEAVARAATGGNRTGNWWLDPDEGGVAEVSCLDVQGFITAVDVDAAHVARHDPARVLAECEAKRQIMSRAMLLLDSWDAVERGHPEEAPYPDVTRRERSFWRSTLRDLAELYADHPDYRDEWRP